MRRHLFAAALIVSSLSFSLAARAQEGGQDEVSLKNGGVVRGTVVSSEPGTSVKIIEMGQKEVRVIPWAQVSDVERGKYAPKAAPPPGPTGPGYGVPQPVAPAEPKLGAPGVVRLHVDSPVPAQVIEHAGTTVGGVGGYTMVIEQLRPVCTSPCDRVVDGSKGQLFAVAGEFPIPKPFTLSEYSGDVTLSVQPGNKGVRIGGAWAIILGASSMVTGAVLLPLALLRDNYSGPRTGIRNAGIGTLVGGGLVLAGGIVMVALSGTKMRLDQGAPPRTGKITPRYWMGEF